MIINCGIRRIVSDRYGYKIEIRHVYQEGKSAGKVVWKEDRPAYPNTLAHALELVYERTLADNNPEIDVRDLPDACLRAAQSVIDYTKVVRLDGKRQTKATKEK